MIKNEKKYKVTYLMIDYMTKKLSFKKKDSKELDDPGKLKFIRFSDVYDVEKANLNIWEGEADVKLLKGKEKFIVYT